MPCLNWDAKHTSPQSDPDLSSKQHFPSINEAAREASSAPTSVTADRHEQLRLKIGVRSWQASTHELVIIDRPYARTLAGFAWMDLRARQDGQDN